MCQAIVCQARTKQDVHVCEKMIYWGKQKKKVTLFHTVAVGSNYFAILDYFKIISLLNIGKPHHNFPELRLLLQANSPKQSNLINNDIQQREVADYHVWKLDYLITNCVNNTNVSHMATTPHTLRHGHTQIRHLHRVIVKRNTHTHTTHGGGGSS